MATAEKSNGKKLNSDSLDSVMKYMGSLITLKDIVLAPTKKGYCVFGSDGGAQVRVEMPPSSVELKEPVKISALSFQKAIGGRKELTITAANGILSIKSKGYQAELAVMEVTEQTDLEPQGDVQEIKFSAATWAWFAASVQALQVETVPGMELTFMGKVGPKTVFTAVYDSTQMAFQTGDSGELGSQEFEITLPYERIARIMRGLPFADSRLLVSPGGIYVMTKMLRAFLPSVSEEAAVSPDDVIAKVKDIIKTKGSIVQLDNESLKAFLNNASSVSNGSAASVTFIGKGDKVAVQAESSSGKVKSLLLGKCGKPFALDLRFLATMASKVKKDVMMTVTDSMAIARSTQGESKLYYVTALQSDEGSGGDTGDDE